MAYTIMCGRDEDVEVNGVLYASYVGDVELLERELSRGESATSVDRYGRPAIRLAIERPCAECVRLLIENGADARAHEHYPYEFFYLAAIYERFDILDMLSRQQGDEKAALNLLPGLFQNSIYEYLGDIAKRTGSVVSDEQIFKAIEREEADRERHLYGILKSMPLNPDARRADGSTMLHAYLQAKGARAGVVAHMLQIGCDANSKDSRGWTPLKVLHVSGAVELDQAKEIHEMLLTEGGRYEPVAGIRDWVRARGWWI